MPQKIVLRAPCKECPFLKKSAPGWLGGDKPNEVWAKVHSDQEFGYPCHMDAEVMSRRAAADDPEAEDWKTRTDSTEQCAGALLHAHKTAKRYSDKLREAARQALAAVFGTDMVMGIEFMEHHGKAGRVRR